MNEDYGEDGLEQFDENDDRFSQEVYQLNQNDSSWIFIIDYKYVTSRFALIL